jgi:glycosyltransferase involved in cell wall biosynthesis
MSVCIVTVSMNQGLYLEQAIRSVLDQEGVSLEYVVADGGSTDGSVAVIRRYESRLTKWYSHPDGGPAAALNKAFEASGGELLGYVNADDFLLPGALAKVAAAFAAHPEADVVYGDGILVDATGTLRRRLYSDRWSLKRYAHGACMITQPATFFRRQAFARAGGFNPANRTCWDGELLIDLASQGARFRQLYEPLAAFRRHADSISGSGRLQREYDRECERLFQKIMKRKRTAADRLLRDRAWRFVKNLTKLIRITADLGR